MPDTFEMRSEGMPRYIGKITSGNTSANLNIRFDDERKPCNCHPFYLVKYYDKDGRLIFDTGEAPFG